MNFGMQNTASGMRPLTPVAGGLLQRACACGQHTIAGGTCDSCRRKNGGLLQRAALNAATTPVAPPIVHDVLSSPGLPLDSASRNFFEPKFERDFSNVRVHADSRAAESATAVDADAYTVGSHIVFGPGRFQPQSGTGRSLVAHELAHVVQQHGWDHSMNELKIGEPNDVAEREADRVSEKVIADGSVTVGYESDKRLRRRLKAARPNDPIGQSAAPNQTGQQQTNGDVVEDYLRRLSTEGAPTVDRTSGEVTIGGDFCRHRGFFERVGRGIGSGFVKGAEIGAYFFGIGAIPGSIIGGLIGGIAGIFGSDSKAEDSSTPTGSTCLCDMVNSQNTWTIQLQNFAAAPSSGQRGISREPATSDLDRHARTGLIVVPTPNSERMFGATLASGRLENTEPWLILGHELCGHAWRQDQGHRDENEEELVQGEELRHRRTVERENLIRAEHGLEARGFRIRDPYCGESFTRPQGSPTATPTFGPSQGSTGTRLDDCQRAREQYLPEQARRYRVDQRIP